MPAKDPKADPRGHFVFMKAEKNFREKSQEVQKSP